MNEEKKAILDELTQTAQANGEYEAPERPGYKRGKCVPPASCLACDRRGYHLEPMSAEAALIPHDWEGTSSISFCTRPGCNLQRADHAMEPRSCVERRRPSQSSAAQAVALHSAAKSAYAAGFADGQADVDRRRTTEVQPDPLFNINVGQSAPLGSASAQQTSQSFQKDTSEVKKVEEALLRVRIVDRHLGEVRVAFRPTTTDEDTDEWVLEEHVTTLPADVEVAIAEAMRLRPPLVSASPHPIAPLVEAIRDAVEGLDTISEDPKHFARTAGFTIPLVRGGLVSALAKLGIEHLRRRERAPTETNHLDAADASSNDLAQRYEAACQDGPRAVGFAPAPAKTSEEGGAQHAHPKGVGVPVLSATSPRAEAPKSPGASAAAGPNASVTGGCTCICGGCERGLHCGLGDGGAGGNCDDEDRARPGEVGTHTLTPTQIAVARAAGGLRVTARGLGFARVDTVPERLGPKASPIASPASNKDST